MLLGPFSLLSLLLDEDSDIPAASPHLSCDLAIGCRIFSSSQLGVLCNHSSRSSASFFTLKVLSADFTIDQLFPPFLYISGIKAFHECAEKVCPGGVLLQQLHIKMSSLLFLMLLLQLRFYSLSVSALNTLVYRINVIRFGLTRMQWVPGGLVDMFVEKKCVRNTQIISTPSRFQTCAYLPFCPFYLAKVVKISTSIVTKPISGKSTVTVSVSGDRSLGSVCHFFAHHTHVHTPSPPPKRRHHCILHQAFTSQLSTRKGYCLGLRQRVLQMSSPSSPYKNCTTDPSLSRTYIDTTAIQHLSDKDTT